MIEMRKAISEMVISFRFILICRMLLSYYRFIMATSAKKGRETERGASVADSPLSLTGPR